jgi:hypothetical protein
MNADRYVRPALRATRDGVPDSAVEVGAWVEQLEDLLAGRLPQGSAHDAYDLLALATRLRRCRPALLTELNAAPLMKQAAGAAAAAGSELARRALTVPNPEAWLAEARALDDSWDEVDDPVGRSARAARLIADLDDADLVSNATAQLGEADHDLAGKLGECARWLVDHADAFFPASVWVQAVGLALRPDLTDLDPGLARTAEKYVVLLDAFVGIEEELAFAGQPPLSPGVTRLLRLLRTADRGLTVIGWMPRRIRRRTPLAAKTPVASAPSEGLVTWTEPGGRYYAVLPIPAEAFEDESLTLTIFDDNDRLAGVFGSKHPPARVTLASVPATVDPEGRALFRIEDLLAHGGEDPVLTVDGIVWPRDRRDEQAWSLLPTNV